MNFSCPNEYPILLEKRNECVIWDINYIKIIINDILNYEKNETQLQEKIDKEIKAYNEILHKVESIFTSNNYNLTNIDKGEDQIINAEKIIITLTTIENQKNNLNRNMTTIDLGDCETILRNDYNLTNNETIYMKKIDIIQEGMKAIKVEYDAYSKLSGNNLEKLNLTKCYNKKIFIYIPIEIKDNIDKLNTSSGYYNDICYTATTNDGTDIILNDRKNEFINGDNIICQEDCVFSVYDSNIKKVKCDCQIKESSSSFADMKIDKNKLFDNLKNIKNISNRNILVCYKKLLNISNIFHNIGSLIIICILIFHLVFIFIFYIIQQDNIIKIIKDIIFSLTNKDSINPSKIKKNVQIKIQKRNTNNKINNKNRINNIISLKKIRNKTNSKNLLRNKSNYNNKIILNNNNFFINNKINYNESFFKLKNIKQNESKEINKMINYNNDEINELSYELALTYDKRTYCQYYGNLLKSKHSLIFAFCNNEDYNSKIIKIDLFFIEFSLNYVINALFFDDETMHKIYIDKGSFDLETQIPLTIYSYLISIVLDTPLAFLALSNDSIINFKQNKITSKSRKIGKKLSFCLKTKFVLYFILSFIFLLFFWYYISLFGIIYKKPNIIY